MIAIVSGNTYAGLMLLGHEIIHGATIRQGPLQTFLLYFCFGIFCMSPHLWRVWHNQVHHAHTNNIDYDPDNFGTIEEFEENTWLVRFLCRLGPGSRHWLSSFYLFFAFAVHGANVLLRKSLTAGGFQRLNRRRAVLDSAAMVLFWLVVSVSVGPGAAMFIVVIPMLMANFVVTSYFITNHSLRPLTSRQDSLGTSIDVLTWKPLDHLHFHTSHHVAHHLFPRACSSQLPAIRAWLCKHGGSRFIILRHWKAMYFVTIRLVEVHRIHRRTDFHFDDVAQIFRWIENPVAAVARKMNHCMLLAIERPVIPVS